MEKDKLYYRLKIELYIFLKKIFSSLPNLKPGGINSGPTMAKRFEFKDIARDSGVIVTPELHSKLKSLLKDSKKGKEDIFLASKILDPNNAMIDIYYRHKDGLILTQTCPYCFTILLATGGTVDNKIKTFKCLKCDHEITKTIK